MRNNFSRMADLKKGFHRTVLLKEAVEALNIKKGDVVVDATLGAGGHALEILRLIGEEGKLIAFDVDKKAVDDFEKRVAENFPDLRERLILVVDNFKNIKKVIRELQARGEIKKGKVDAVLADLGWRVEQVRDERYGMSFRKKMPLKMSLNGNDAELTAEKIINEWSEDELKNVFQLLGEEREAGRIARKIVESRQKKRIVTTTQLANLITEAKKIRNGRIHPATKVFQALRIVVNAELSNLESFLEGATDVLESEGRLVVISFHSLEDRTVKKFFRAKARGCVCPEELPVCVCGQSNQFVILQKKGVRPSSAELKENPRARSAVLRILKKENKNKI